MNLELLVILVLITVFFISCCGLLQKIRNYYNEEAVDGIIAVSPVRETNQTYSNGAFQNWGDDYTTGVFPGGYAPPPYIESELQPPKYEDVVKNPTYVVVQVDPLNTETVPQAVVLPAVQTTQVNGLIVALPPLPVHLQQTRSPAY